MDFIVFRGSAGTLLDHGSTKRSARVSKNEIEDVGLSTRHVSERMLHKETYCVTFEL